MITKVFDSVYVSDINSAINNETIEAILNVSLQNVNDRYKVLKENILRIPINDDAILPSDLFYKFKMANDFIDAQIKRGNSVLIHCVAGQNRSIGFVIAWLIDRQRWSFKDAHAHLKNKTKENGLNIDLSGQFIKQLNDYEIIIYKYNAFKDKTCITYI